jgi:small subunit ribosomal protein S1
MYEAILLLYTNVSNIFRFDFSFSARYNRVLLEAWNYPTFLWRTTMDTNPEGAPTSLDQVKRKTHFLGKVVKIGLAGAVIDVGLGVPGVLHISQLQQEPVNRVEDVIHIGQEVDVWVRRISPKGDRIELSMIKPLDLEWREMKKDMVVKGKVVRLERFGAFVDIGAERPGLIHISELTHDYIRSVDEVLKEGDEVEVKILDIDRKKKQIKLSRKAMEEQVVKVAQKQADPAPAEVETPIPTVMEAAMREAMQRVKTRDDDTPRVRGKKTNKPRNDLESIFARTLEHKARSK